MNLKKNISFSLISKISSLLFHLSSLSILSKTLSSRELSVYFLLLNFPFFFSLLDLGQTGGGFQNRLTSFEEQKLQKEKKELFLSHFQLSFSLYSLFYFLLLLIALILKKNGILYFSLSFISIYLLSTLMRFPFSLYGAYASSIQMGFIKYKFDLLEHSCCALFLLICYFHPLAFEVKISFLFFIPFFITLIGFFKLKKMQNILVFSPVGISKIRGYLQIKQGLNFWLQNLLSLALFNTSIYLVAAKLGLEKNSDFFLSMRLINIMVGIHFAFLAPFTTFLIHLFYKQKKEIFQKLIQALLFTTLFFVLAFCFFYLFHPFIEKWLLHKCKIPLHLFFWGTIYGILNVFSIFLNAFNRIKRQLIFLFFGLCMFFSLSLYLPVHPFEKTVVIYSIISILPLLFSNIHECYTLVTNQKKKEDFSY